MEKHTFSITLLKKGKNLQEQGVFHHNPGAGLIRTLRIVQNTGRRIMFIKDETTGEVLLNKLNA